LVQISKSTAFEEGKDIIAVDKKDIPHIYQLKGGNITLKKWRTIVKPEIEELIELPIVHPSVNKKKKAIPYLVTNGYLEDTVRVRIESLNTGKWKHNPLRVIVLGELLEKFLKWSYEFTPQEIDDYKTFLDLYFVTGRDFLDEDKFCRLLNGVLRLNAPNLSLEERKRNIAAAILFTSYILSSFKEKENHIGVTQILVLLTSCILAVVEKYDLPDAYWKGSFDLIWHEIGLNLDLLEKEIEGEGLDRVYESIWDGELGRYRKHVALNYLFAHKLSQVIEGNPLCDSLKRTDFYPKIKDSLTVFGESSLLAYIYIFLYFSKSLKESTKVASWLIVPLQTIISFNGRNGTTGLISPYYSFETAINSILGLESEDTETEESFQGVSFFAKAIIDLLARHNQKEIIQICWRELTYIQYERFVPEKKWMFFLWRSDRGRTEFEFPEHTQSWKKLVTNATRINNQTIPKSILKLPFFLPLFLLVYPHRVDTNLIKYLDSQINTESAKKTSD